MEAVRIGRRKYNKMNWRRKKGRKPQGPTLSQHTYVNHSWSFTSEGGKTGTHTFVWIRADRQTLAHTLHSLSHSTIGWHGLKGKTEQQGIGSRETADSQGETMGSHELSLDHRWLPERCGRNSRNLFSYRQTTLENPRATTSSPVHFGSLYRRFQCQQ